jgi:proteic killer suppression protein
MEIEFASSGLRKLCEESRLMNRKLGAVCARKLRSRLADLRATTTVAELTAGGPHSLKGEWDGRFALNLHGGHRLVFESANEPVPVNENGSIAWERVSKILVCFIGDYHD